MTAFRTLLHKAARRILRPIESTSQPELADYIRGVRRDTERDQGQKKIIKSLMESVNMLRSLESLRAERAITHEEEILAAFRMAGEGPWKMPHYDAAFTGMVESVRAARVDAKEGLPPFSGASAQGAFGDVELALQNVTWMRQINLSWLEFSRWGIQQIILISRLYTLKNPLIQRGVNVCAFYVFGRGVQITATDPDAAEVINDFIERNRATLGQNALGEHERRKWYDGNLFFALFTNKATGEVDIRLIDATEMDDVVADPEDADKPQYYKRVWTQRNFDLTAGTFKNQTRTAWYPALGYEPSVKPPKIGSDDVMWDVPVYHRKCGAVGRWRFGCPKVYAALDWARAAVDFLSACMTIRQSLAQFSMLLTTKGGQQAQAGAKGQLSTTVGPPASLWDQNPTAVDGSIFVSGPGTKLEAFKTQGAGGDMKDAREIKLMVAMVFGLPESFFADMNTSNLATATSLDRPTELAFIAEQEEWREDLTVVTTYALKRSLRAPKGKLRERLMRRAAGTLPPALEFREGVKRQDQFGRVYYEKVQPKTKDTVRILVNFPTIIEADTPEMIKSVVMAGTLGARDGEIHGVDEREMCRLLYEYLAVEDYAKLLEEQYPSDGPDKYDPLRTAPDDPQAQNPHGPEPEGGAPPKGGMSEALRRSIERLTRAITAVESNAGKQS